MLADLAFAFRSLRKSPAFTLVAVVTLALGIGANSGVLSFLHVLLFKPLPLPAVRELVYLGEHSAQVPNMSVAYPNYVDWRSRQQSFAHLGAFRGQSFNYLGPTESERIAGAQFSADLWPALGVAPIRGRWFGPDEDKPGAARTAVVSERFWQTTLGGRPDVLGHPLTLSGEVYTIVGVMPADFRVPVNAPDVWVPLGLGADSMADRGSHPGIYCIGRLKPGVTLETARADLVAIARQLEQEYPRTNTGNSVTVQSLVDRAVGSQHGTIWISFAAALGVLLIACTNVANLLLARAAVRTREFAVRSAIGASRASLVRLVLAESLLLGLAGTALGLLAGYGVMQGIKSLIPANSPFVTQVAMDPAVLGLAIAIGLGVTAGFGLVPALSGTRVVLTDALAAGGRTGGGSVQVRWRSTLVVAEFALTLALLFASGLMIRTIHALYRADLGLRTDRIVTFNYSFPGRDWADPAKRNQLLDRALEKLGALPGVTHVALTNPLPLSGGGNQTSFVVEGRPEPGPGRRPSTENNAASAAYFETLRIPLLRGRLFTDREQPGDPATVIIDTKFAETHFAGEDPLGRRIAFGPPDQPSYATVIGVVGHVQNYGLGQDTRVQLYYPYRRTPPGFVSFVLRTGQDAASLGPALRAVMREVEPTLPIFSLRTLDELFDASVTNQRVMLRLLVSFALIALLLAAIGLYGVLSYLVAQRTREVGIRMALGATESSVRQLMLGQGLRLALIGLGLGLVAAVGLGRAMSSVLYGVSPLDPLSLGAVALVLLAIGALASWLPAHRATRVNPVEALRAD